ncbi:MAG: adenylate/guanylate cyclase domain-containing protein [Planctomycetes bacterium]|nr:adenylate/guanylate cyclase domain-containing protein [Planctomycetota bacterium]
MSKSLSSPAVRSEQPLLIVFADITRFQHNARGTPDTALADLMDAYYRFAEAQIAGSGGRLVKFMGDAFLATWPEDRAAAGVAALQSVKQNIDAWWAGKGWDSRVVIKAHFGTVVAGPFGVEGRFDVIGNEVNIAATLPARTIAMSPEAFRCLGAAERKEWKKHTAQVVYIPGEDSRP